MRFVSILLLFCGCIPSVSGAEDTNRHVVVVVWDGMRPDFVSESNTPALFEMASRGVVFANNHCVYLTSTEVNGATLATGMYPERNGVIGNIEYRPDVDSRRAVATEGFDTIRKSERTGKYLEAPTVAEILHAQGRRTAVAGSKGVALLHDFAERESEGDNANPVLADRRTLPEAAFSRLSEALGPQPDSPMNGTKTNRDLWVTRSLIGPMWEKGVPTFSLLWLGEPDNSQHTTGPGSRQSLAVIRNSDHALSLVIAALKEKGVYDTTDIFVVSDHGFSTITRSMNVVSLLRKQGFNAARTFQEQPAKGDVLVVGLGGSVILYVAGHDEETIGRLVRCLQKDEHIGVIFTRRAQAGTFALDDGLINSPHTPDLVFSFRWSDEKNANGVPGYVFADTQSTNISMNLRNLRGTHVSLSPFDLHNTLIAAGPDFRQGLVNQTASGNVDVAPTVLHVLGIEPPQPMDGRVLFEALKGNTNLPQIGTRQMEARAKLPGGEWAQRLSITEVNGVRYLERGSGEFTPDAAAEKRHGQ